MESAVAAPARCEIARLPDDLLSATLALTAPRDACVAAAVSPDFRAAADADAVWSSLLPRDLPPLAVGELPAGPQPTKKKQLFMRLSDSARPVLLADGLTSMWLDRETGAKCYMLSARKLGIAWGDTPQYWSWIPITDSRFSEAAALLHVCWLEIRAEMDSKMLSQRMTYMAYIVFRLANKKRRGLSYTCPQTSVLGGSSSSTRLVCLDDKDDRDHRDRWLTSHVEVPQPGALFPRDRGDGWMEVEMGEFHSSEGDDGDISISLKETSFVKSGLIVLGIEIRPKE